MAKMKSVRSNRSGLDGYITLLGGLAQDFGCFLRGAELL